MAHWHYRHHSLRKYWWVIVLAAILCLFFLRVPYDSFPSSAPGLFCEYGELKTKNSEDSLSRGLDNQLIDLALDVDALVCSVNAEGDLSVYSQLRCVKSQPTIICKTQLYKAILMGRVIFPIADKKTEPTAEEIEQKLEMERKQNEEYEATCKEECKENSAVFAQTYDSYEVFGDKLVCYCK